MVVPWSRGAYRMYIKRRLDASYMLPVNDLTHAEVAAIIERLCPRAKTASGLPEREMVWPITGLKS